MPRMRTDVLYEKLIGVYAEEGLKPPAITLKLAEMDRPSHWPAPPKLRTVAKIYGDHMGLPPAVREEVKLFRWPEAFELRLLPWEAAGMALDLLRYCDLIQAGRPTVGMVKWFWRLTLIDPDMDIEIRSDFASYLATEEWARLTGRPDDVAKPNGLEWYLAYHPWRSDEDGGIYARALTRENHPIPAINPVLKSADVAHRYVRNLQGHKAADAVMEEIEKMRREEIAREEAGKEARVTRHDLKSIAERLSTSSAARKPTEPYTLRTQPTGKGLFVWREQSDD